MLFLMYPLMAQCEKSSKFCLSSAYFSRSSSDTFSDLTKRYPTDSAYEKGKNLYGSLKQLYILKKKNRHLKSLISIGGFTFSKSFPGAASDNTTRAKFASDTVSFVKDLGFDGVDIDWEYPTDDIQAANFVLLLAEVRKKLDEYAEKYTPGYHYLLTVACPAGEANYRKLHLSAMDPYIDNWNLMAYDYSGSWSKNASHSANLYPSSSKPYTTPINTHKVISDYVSAGVPASKITMGIPLYGRSFQGTAGLGQKFTSVGNGSWEPGIWDYKALPQVNSNSYTDDEAIASYSYTVSSQTLISYDDVEIVKKKTDYILSKNLAGAMFWESSGDKNGSQSLISTAANAFEKLDETQNCLSYPASEYSNVVAGMPGE